MDDWGPEEWAIAWQSAPVHLLQRREQEGHSGSMVEDGHAVGEPGQRPAPDDRNAGARRPGVRPPPSGPPTRRPKLTRTAGRASAGGSAAPGNGPDHTGSVDSRSGPGHADQAERLGVRIRGMAADLAASMCEWLHLIEQFDRERGWAEAGLQSCAAWLSWTCSVAPGTAREYVRIARMLPLLPLVDEAFAAGRLSYSKVRVLVQVAAEVDEAVLLQQAQVQTVSQFERTVRAYRRTEGWSVERKRRATWRWDDDGMLVVFARLPPDEGALLVAALERSGDDIAPRSDDSCGASDGRRSVAAAESRCGDEPSGDDGCSGDEHSGDGHPPATDRSSEATPAAAQKATRRPMPEPSGEDRRRAALTGADPLGMVGADTLVALAQRALAAGDVDSSGDDRHLLVLHADLDQLVGDPEPVDHSEPAEPAGPVDHSEPAGSADLAEPTGTDPDPVTVQTPDAAGPRAGRHSWRRTAAATGAATAAGTAIAVTLAGPRCHLEDGPGLDRRTAQRIACDAALVAVLHHVGEGEPLRLGRKTRTISPAQRRALRIRDGGCRGPGCHRRHHLEAHHVRHWSLLGPTDLDNLVLLCRFHHMLIHEGGFRVSAAGEGTWQFHDPRGVLVPTAPPLSGGSRCETPPARAADPLGLLPGWAGEPFHLAETVAVLSNYPRAGAR